MITSQDRSGWFGASDTSTIMGGWDTKTFARLWLEKLGLLRSTYRSSAMLAGTYYEHRILDHLGIRRRDRQIKMRRLRLRVNLDGETDMIHEVKTYSGETFQVSKAYWRQAQVEMFASITLWRRVLGLLLGRQSHKSLEIVAYRLLPEDYQNFYNPIDPERISRHPVEYDPGWIKNEYLPRLRYLSKCLRRRTTPEVNGWQS